MTNYEEEYPQWNDWHWQMRNRATELVNHELIYV